MRNKQFRVFFNLRQEREKRRYVARKKARDIYGSRISAYTSAHTYTRTLIPRVRKSPSPPQELFFPSGIRIDIKRNNIVGI